MNENNEINQLKTKINNLEQEVVHLKNELNKREKQMEEVPQLSQTSIGKATSNGKIIYRNWWSAFISEFDGFCDVIWFTRFLNNRFPDADYKINMFSVFGEHNNLTKEMDGKKVLFSGENLNKRFLHFNKTFGRYALDYVDLAMGFDFINHPKYLRFPLWILFNFLPEFTEENIENKINEINSLNYTKTKDVAVIASHDNWKTRSMIVNDLDKFTNISYAGKWHNNTNELWEKFDNNKNNYLKQFKFNICPENILDDGYVTEKIFDSIKCDCIPLYAGGGNYLEPEVINKNAIITWDLEKDNSDSVELFKTLISDRKSYDNFKDQNVLLDKSAKYIINQFNALEKQFERLIYD